MTEEDAEKATQLLVDTAYQYGEAQARAVKAEAMLRHVKALKMKSWGKDSLGAQEREAYASPEYADAIEELQAATLESRSIQAERQAAMIRVDFWRSVNARQRGA